MTTGQKQCTPSFTTILSVLSIVFYCAGFLRVEVELNEQKKRINALENVADWASIKWSTLRRNNN